MAAKIGKFSLLLIIACSPKSSGETEASTGAETTATSSETTDTTTDTTAPTTTSGQVCESFLDQEVTGPAVAVTIENRREEAVFVLPGPGCSGRSRLELRRDGATLRFHDATCDFTCADHFAGGCQCEADCPASPAIRIEPSGRFRYTWSGALFVPVSPPESCFASECGSSCEQRQQAGPGAYEFASAAGLAASVCGDSPELCECMANADGWCELPGLDGAAFAEVVELAAGFTYPEQTAAALIVE